MRVLKVKKPPFQISSLESESVGSKDNGITMSSPAKPKEMKPKDEGEAAPAASGAASAPAAGGLDLKFIILVVVMVVSSILGSAGSVYLMTSMFVTPEIQKLAKAKPAEGAEAEKGGEEKGEASTNEIGMNLELDEFMVNLKTDAALGGNQYLKTKVALSIKPPDKENCFLKKEKAQFSPADGKVIAFKPSLLGYGTLAGAAAPIAYDTNDLSEFDPTLLAGEGEGGPPPCETEFKANMGHYVPTIRDVINSSLMK